MSLTHEKNAPFSMTTYLVFLARLVSKSFTKNTSYNHLASICSRMEKTSATLKFFTWSWCICFLHMLHANSLPFPWSPFTSSFFHSLFSVGYRLFFETSKKLSQETMACALGHGMFNSTRFSSIGVGCSCCFKKSLTLSILCKFGFLQYTHQHHGRSSRGKSWSLR